MNLALSFMNNSMSFLFCLKSFVFTGLIAMQKCLIVYLEKSIDSKTSSAISGSSIDRKSIDVGESDKDL